MQSKRFVSTDKCWCRMSYLSPSMANKTPEENADECGMMHSVTHGSPSRLLQLQMSPVQRLDALQRKKTEMTGVKTKTQQTILNQ